MKDVLLNIKNLCVYYQNIDTSKSALKNFSCTFYKNEVVSIIGETGSGKTTLERTIINLLPQNAYITSGQVIYNGTEISNYSHEEMENIWGKEIGVVLQDSDKAFSPIFNMGTQTIDVLKGKYGKMKKSELKEYSVKILSQLNISSPKEVLKKYPHQLSGGMKQRINIGLALELKPKLLILDEPTSALDANTRESTLEYIYRRLKGCDTTLIYITHDINLARKISDRLIIMKDGSIDDDIIKDANGEFIVKTEYAKQLLRAVDLLSNNGIINNYRKVVLELKNLYKDFNRTSVLKDISFKLYEGECLGIVGESGCGKTTIAKMLIGEYKYDKGEINLNYKSSEIEMVYQNPINALNPKMKVLDILNEVNVIKKSSILSKEELAKLLKTMELEESILFRIPSQLSGGQKQKIAIARALINNPKVIIFDEPTSALDVSTQKNLLDLLLKIKKEKQISYLFISHDIKVINYMCNRVIYLEKGRITEKSHTEHKSEFEAFNKSAVTR